MAFAFKVYPGHRLGVVRLGGAVTGHDFVSALEGYLQEPAWQPGFSTLWDLRPIQELVMRVEEVPDFVTTSRNLSKRRGSGKSAFVVRRQIDWGIALLLSVSYKDPTRRVKVFWNLREAGQWLGTEIPPEYESETSLPDELS